MKKIEGTKPVILRRRAEVIWQLSDEGFGDIDIGKMVGLDRTQVYRIKKQRPDNWDSSLTSIPKFDD